MYNFNNKTDEQLTELSAAIYAEQKRRIQAKIESYPAPIPAGEEAGFGSNSNICPCLD